MKTLVIVVMTVFIFCGIVLADGADKVTYNYNDHIMTVQLEVRGAEALKVVNAGATPQGRPLVKAPDGHWAVQSLIGWKNALEAVRRVEELNAKYGKTPQFSLETRQLCTFQLQATMKSGKSRVIKQSVVNPCFLYRTATRSDHGKWIPEQPVAPRNGWVEAKELDKPRLIRLIWKGKEIFSGALIKS